MKVSLAFEDRRLDLRADPAESTPWLVPDLGVDIVIDAMAAGDELIRDIASRMVLSPLGSVAEVRYRQAILADCLANPEIVRQLYAHAVETLEKQRHLWGLTSQSPSSVLYWAGDSLKVYVPALRQLREIAVAHRPAFRSAGFSRLLAEIESDLGDEYLASVEDHLRRLRFDSEVTLSARLGAGNRGAAYVLRRRTRQPGWRSWVGLAEPGTHVFQLNPRDVSGAQMLGDIQAQGTALAAAALGKSADHIGSYFTQLRGELAFYVGCLNLHDRLAAKGLATARPEPASPGSRELAAKGLYDVALALASPEPVVANDVDADGKLLILVTGANRGWKSTFLRSVGLAQLLMQAGMFVPAASFRADLRAGIFTHFKREEDASLRSGKLDEELGRMSWIVDRVTPDSLVLMNESFAATNEREGSEIGRQVVSALLEAGVRVGFVTHLFDLAEGFERSGRTDALYLRAERLPDGHRTYRVVPGEPLPTSHGQDIYRSVFGEDGPAPAAPPAGP